MQRNCGIDRLGERPCRSSSSPSSSSAASSTTCSRARTGPHANDADLALGLATARLLANDFQEARHLCEQLRTDHPKFREQDVALVRARALEGLGKESAALDEYERLAVEAVGLEAKVRHGQLLKRLGYATHARNVFEQVLVHAKRFKLKHEAEEVWVSVAKKELAQ